MYSNHWTKTEFASEPMKIGKKEWRVIVYQSKQYGFVTSYQFRIPADRTWDHKATLWADMVEWPSYNSNDGMYAGCPKTLVKLYNNNKTQIEKALGNA